MKWPNVSSVALWTHWPPSSPLKGRCIIITPWEESTRLAFGRRGCMRPNLNDIVTLTKGWDQRAAPTAPPSQWLGGQAFPDPSSKQLGSPLLTGSSATGGRRGQPNPKLLAACRLPFSTRWKEVVSSKHLLLHHHRGGAPTGWNGHGSEPSPQLAQAHWGHKPHVTLLVALVHTGSVQKGPGSIPGIFR